MDIREKLVELLDDMQRSGTSYFGNAIENKKIADYLIAHGVTVQENVEISDELLKQLKNAPITICKEEPSIELTQEWISVDNRLPENEQDVIICAKRRHYSNPNCFIRIVAKAFYTDGKHNTEQTAYDWNNDCIDMEYDEENDAYLIPEGWWESVEYGEEFSAVSDFVTHWMPLPQPLKGE